MFLFSTANFQLPVEGDPFDSVEFAELGREESEKLVEEYNREAIAKGKKPNSFRGGRGGGFSGGNRGRQGIIFCKTLYYEYI